VARKEESHISPYFFPDGRHFAYTVDGGAAEYRGVFLASLDGTDRTLLVPALSNVSLASGRLVFVRGRTLVAQPFDVARLRVFGEPEVLAHDLVRDIYGPTAAFAASLTGRIAYLSDPSLGRKQLTWVDRAGRQVGTVGEPGLWSGPKISPDGHHLVADATDPAGTGADLWLFDVSRDSATRFTSSAEWNSWGYWSPDGSRIAFSSERSGIANVYEKSVDGSTREDPLFVSNHQNYPTGWSADGRYLLVQVVELHTRHRSAGIWSSASAEKPSVLLDSRFNVTAAKLSSDMRWLAYVSDESGRDEVYVLRFPDANRRRFPLTGRAKPVSTAGGTLPHWRRDGRELFFMDRDRNILAVDVREDHGELSLGVPTVLFNLGDADDIYDVAADGQRFLMVEAVATLRGKSITMLADWASR
jgi:Tol biopolymer transport system component